MPLNQHSDQGRTFSACQKAPFLVSTLSSGGSYSSDCKIRFACLELPINVIVQYILLCVLFLLSALLWDSCTLITRAVFFQSCVVFHCTDTGQLVYSPADGHADGFQFGAITNKVAMNILVPVFWWTWHSFLLGIHLEIKFLNRRVKIPSLLWILRISHSGCTLWEFSLPHILTNTWYCMT